MTDTDKAQQNKLIRVLVWINYYGKVDYFNCVT